MRTQSLLLILLVSAVAISTTVSAAARVGGWTKISDPSDPHVQEIGKFAVTEHNSKSAENLVFVAVVSGQTQVVSGINYKLLVSVKDGGVGHTYEAVVWEKPWENFKQLTSFVLKA